jgi:hypothetical protein
MLLDLISDVSSWSGLEARIAALSEEHERGIAFEEFCIAYFALSDLFQFKTIYRHYEIPPSLCKQLGYLLHFSFASPHLFLVLWRGFITPTTGHQHSHGRT